MSRIDHLCSSLIISIGLLFPIPSLSQANERQMDRIFRSQKTSSGWSLVADLPEKLPVFISADIILTANETVQVLKMK